MQVEDEVVPRVVDKNKVSVQGLIVLNTERTGNLRMKHCALSSLTCRSFAWCD